MKPIDEFIASLPPQIQASAGAKLQEVLKQEIGDRVNEVLTALRLHANSIDSSASRVAGELENRLLNLDLAPLLQQMEGVSKTTADNIFTTGSLTSEVGGIISQFSRFRHELANKSMAVSRSWWWFSLVSTLAVLAIVMAWTLNTQFKTRYETAQLKAQQDLYSHIQAADAEYANRYEAIAKAAVGNQRAFLGLSEANIHLGLEEYGGRTFVTVPGHVKVWYSDTGGGMIELTDIQDGDNASTRTALKQIGN